MNKRKLDSDETLPLNEFLKLLTTPTRAPLSMSQAMEAAGKLIPAGYNSKPRLRLLMQEDMLKLGIANAEIRRSLRLVVDSLLLGHSKAKRPFRERRDSDLDRPLPTPGPSKAAARDTDFVFDEIEYEPALETKSVVINRAPVMMAWAFTVAQRLGFHVQEALSLAQVYTELNANSRAVALGRETQRTAPVSSAQPFVELMGRKIAILSLQSGEWRALRQGQTRTLEQGNIVEPTEAFQYMKHAFRQQLGATIGAMRLLAQSFEPKELNSKGYGLYVDFRPPDNGWGKRSEMRMAAILALRRFLTHGEARDHAPSEAGPNREVGDSEDKDKQIQKTDTAYDISAIKHEPNADSPSHTKTSPDTPKATSQGRASPPCKEDDDDGLGDLFDDQSHVLNAKEDTVKKEEAKNVEAIDDFDDLLDDDLDISNFDV